MVLEDKKTEYAAIAVLFLMTVASIGYTAHLNQQVNQLKQELQESRNVVQLNSTGRPLTEIYNQVENSVVSVTTEGAESAQGSGFVYSKKGYIVTNQHVIEGAEAVEVTFTGGETVPAKIVGTDKYSDLAVLKVNKTGLKPLQLANYSDIQVGQKAVAVGNPFGLRSTMTSGIISQKGRMLRTEGGFSIPNVLQTDAAINPGNSGGPLLNMKGEVVGVNTAIETNTGTFTGVGFAVPVTAVQRVVPDIIKKGDYKHPWMGVSGFSVNSEIARKMNLSRSSGFLVVNVVTGSPADKAGIIAGTEEGTVSGRSMMLGGDVIIAINDRKIRDISDIIQYLERNTEVGEKINVTVIRDGERKKIPLKLGARPNDAS
ncbi:MAG: S1C family serine protease [Candidatus Nanohaloarchaea archaeon]